MLSIYITILLKEGKSPETSIEPASDAAQKTLCCLERWLSIARPYDDKRDAQKKELKILCLKRSLCMNPKIEMLPVLFQNAYV